MDISGREMPVERFEPSTLAGLVFETSAYTVPPHRLTTVRGSYDNASVVRSQVPIKSFFTQLRKLPTFAHSPASRTRQSP
jgi:hypothetical protein